MRDCFIALPLSGDYEALLRPYPVSINRLSLRYVGAVAGGAGGRPDRTVLLHALTNTSVSFDDPNPSVRLGPLDQPDRASPQNEYQRAMIAAELAWVEKVLEELKTGTLTWTADDFAGAADAYRQD